MDINQVFVTLEVPDERPIPTMPESEFRAAAKEAIEKLATDIWNNAIGSSRTSCRLKSSRNRNHVKQPSKTLQYLMENMK